jgi:hypothetical protein
VTLLRDENGHGVHDSTVGSNRVVASPVISDGQPTRQFGNRERVTHGQWCNGERGTLHVMAPDAMCEQLSGRYDFQKSPNVFHV